MNATEIGAPAGHEGALAAVEERPDEMASAMALAGAGHADGVIDDGDEWVSPLRPEDQPPTAEQGVQLGQEPNALFEEEKQQKATASEGQGDRYPRTAVMTSPKAARAKLGNGVTIRVMGEANATAPSADDSGDKAEAPQPVDALARPPILNVGEGELVPKERYAGRVDKDKFAGCWFGTYGDEDYLVIEARLADQGEYIPCLNGKGELLTDPVLLMYARRIGIPIKYRIYKNLTEAESRAFVLESQDGGRLRTPKQRRQLKHARVLTLLDIRAGSDKRLTFAEIGRRVGYTEARVRQIYKKSLESGGRNISDPESRETPAAPSKSGSPAKKAKEKKVAACATEPMAAVPQPPRQVAGFDPTQVAIDRLDMAPVDAEILMEKSKEAGARRFKDLLAGHSGGNRAELRLTLTSIVEFESARATALSYLEGLLAAGNGGPA